MDNSLINSGHSIGDKVYYIIGFQILEREIIGVKAEIVKEYGEIRRDLFYKISIDHNKGWVRPCEIFATKREAGEHILEQNGLTVNLTEVNEK